MLARSIGLTRKDRPINVPEARGSGDPPELPAPVCLESPPARIDTMLSESREKVADLNRRLMALRGHL